MFFILLYFLYLVIYVKREAKSRPCVLYFIFSVRSQRNLTLNSIFFCLQASSPNILREPGDDLSKYFFANSMQ
jgi:hypothetical protein